MSKTPELNIYKRPEKPKPYYLNISAKLSDTGKRTAKAFKTLTEAKNVQHQLLNKLKREGREGYTFTKKEAVDAKRALELLKDRDDNLHDLVRESLEARDVLNNADLNEGYELSLLKASKHLVEHYKHKEQSFTFEEVYQKSLRSRKSRGKWSTSYARDQDWVMKGAKPHSLASDEDRIKEKSFMHHFGSILIDEITEDEIRDFMDEHYNTNPNTYNYCHGIIHPAFKYAHDRGWISVDPMKLIEKKHIPIDTKILTISEFNLCVELMNTEKYQSLAVTLALLMFSGMRRDELKGNNDKTPLKWKNIITNPTGAHTLPYIEISPEQSKGTSARLITIQPNLLKWIETVPESKRVGFIIPSNFDRLMKSFRLEAGIKGNRNIIRHSFGAYHYHRWADQGATMKEMGHTKVSTFMKHYYAWNPEEDAPYLYWRLLPKGAEMDNVIKPKEFNSAAS
jgi:integrase